MYCDQVLHQRQRHNHLQPQPLDQVAVVAAVAAAVVLSHQTFLRCLSGLTRPGVIMVLPLLPGM